MSDPFIVRAAAASDFDGLRALLVDVDELHRLNVPWMFRKPSAEPRPNDFFEKQLTHDDSTLLVADAGGHLVGVAAALMRGAPEFAVFVTQRWGVLDNIAVSPSWRRRGVGTALIRGAEGWARARGANWVELGVYEFNDDARRFYQALGYAAVLTKFRKPLSHQP